MTRTLGLKMTYSWLTKVWTTAKFVCFGIAGFFVFFAASLSVAFPDDLGMNRYLAGLLAIVGLTMVLYGVGQWGRWGYVLVFLAFPLCVFLSSSVPALNDKGSPVLFGGAVAFITYRLVRRFYQKRNPAHGKSVAEPGSAPNGGPATRLGNPGVTKGPPSVS